jgi:hypothetical protein
VRLALAGILILLYSPSAHAAAGITFEPAPEGEPAIVAQEIIQANFDEPDCPLVVDAKRLGDGTIRASCSSGEIFRVFSMPSMGGVALKCSAALKMGIEGC